MAKKFERPDFSLYPREWVAAALIAASNLPAVSGWTGEAGIVLRAKAILDLMVPDPAQSGAGGADLSTKKGR